MHLPPLVKKLFWPVVGLAAVAVSLRLLFDELRGVSLEEVGAGLAGISLLHWLLASLSALGAYAALAGYDRIALRHLGKQVPTLFVFMCSFITYALAHNIGGSVFSGAVVRYRAYRTQGLTPHEVGMLVALCSFTFILSCILAGSLAMAFNPHLLERFTDIPGGVGAELWIAALGFLLVGAYAAGSLLHRKRLKLGAFTLSYPSPGIVLRQLIVGPAELLAAAAIIYFVLPEANHPGYLTVLGIFMISFSAALISHAPGGIGVLEVVFVKALPELDPADVLAALLVFRLLYLIIPLILSLPVVLWFERREYLRQSQSDP